MKVGVCVTLLSVLNIIVLCIVYSQGKQMESSSMRNNSAPQLSYKVNMRKKTPVCTAKKLIQLQQSITADETGGEVHDILNVYKKIEHAMPQIYATLMKLENAYAKIKRYDDAITAHKTAVNLNPLILLRSLGLTVISEKTLKSVSKKRKVRTAKLIVAVRRN